MEKLIALFIIRVLIRNARKITLGEVGGGVCMCGRGAEVRRGEGRGEATCGNAECGGSEVSNSAQAICIPPVAAGLVGCCCRWI